jgi:hypothetical protein
MPLVKPGWRFSNWYPEGWYQDHWWPEYGAYAPPPMGQGDGWGRWYPPDPELLRLIRAYLRIKIENS